MLTHPLLEQLKTLRCEGMLEAFQEQLNTPDINRLAFDERFALLIEREYLTRENRKLINRLRQAKLKEEACVEDIDYSPERQLSKTVITRLAECSWIKKKENVLITGPTGAGKTYLACAFANQACRQGYGSRYIRLPKLFQAITIAKADGSYIKLMEHVAKLSLLVLDDWGLAPMTDANRRDLLEIIDDRYERSSTLITSQLPVHAWHDSVGDATLGDAILDRLVHNAHRIAVHGPSMREKIAKKKHKKENLE
ncbi:TPA: IS21-like element helper ATPase IstB [Legionella pneumophila]|nr:AAA family ATPase [Legionella pneumophila]HAU1484911.1 AAA family ATPase [Legionella pneumophila]HAU1500751.1 AAA family ATPase [Legionella pneumophila]HAU1519581.1 AAA family ATPase [Legionella pneumophila]HAU3746203.1 AAA family ATPase [Legionella pneumophila]